ncbi:hypothetical protein [Streptomyces sp. MI02-7b]|uniref:hypothetical protein n=1 Tax=Streptomyces sp. MI02-7b TaxID=462941 RepID=UPI0029A283FC|nr:hypothetical protein [Streptomyces sp. MI02-7b]MDX3071896.1 hypothetical protein [Streptomyces sp. MI02-7b]
MTRAHLTKTARTAKKRRPHPQPATTPRTAPPAPPPAAPPEGAAGSAGSPRAPRAEPPQAPRPAEPDRSAAHSEPASQPPTGPLSGTPEDSGAPASGDDAAVGASEPTAKQVKAAAKAAAKETRAAAEQAEAAAEEAELRLAEAAEAAFDTLYAHAAPALIRQAEVLTGNEELARYAVHRAFDRAWLRWPEVATDPDPVGWLRSQAFELALAPWQQLLPWHRTPRRARGDLQRLPRGARHAVLLHEGLGLGLRRTAAESMASTPTTAARIIRARDALGEEAVAGLAGLLNEPRVPELPAEQVREMSEERLRHQTLGSVAATIVLVLLTAGGLVFGPLSDHFSVSTPLIDIRFSP